MLYFVHHETRILWAQEASEPIVDDGMVGECDRQRFNQLIAQGYLDKTGEPAAILTMITRFNTPDKDPDPWT